MVLSMWPYSLLMRCYCQWPHDLSCTDFTYPVLMLPILYWCYLSCTDVTYPVLMQCNGDVVPRWRRSMEWWRAGCSSTGTSRTWGPAAPCSTATPATPPPTTAPSPSPSPASRATSTTRSVWRLSVGICRHPVARPWKYSQESQVCRQAIIIMCQNTYLICARLYKVVLMYINFF